MKFLVKSSKLFIFKKNFDKSLAFSWPICLMPKEKINLSNSTFLEFSIDFLRLFEESFPLDTFFRRMFSEETFFLNFFQIQKFNHTWQFGPEAHFKNEVDEELKDLNTICHILTITKFFDNVRPSQMKQAKDIVDINYVR